MKDRTNRAKVAGLVLAAGRSRRMGETNKLLVPLRGQPLLLHLVHALKTSRASPLLAITGYESERVGELLRHQGITCLHNPEYRKGFSTSLRRGLAALSGDVEAVLICLGDMPWVTASVIDAVIEAFAPEHGREIIVPTWRGQRGHPVLFSRRFFADLNEIRGDVGGRDVIDKNPEHVFLMAVKEKGVIMDVDRPQALSSNKKKSEAAHET